MLPTIFQTPRLQARLPIPSDAAAIFKAYTSKPEVARYMMWVKHMALADSEAFISGCIAAVQSGTRFPYVLSEQHNPTAPIGMLEARPSGHKIDLGYVLAPELWGRGYMPEAVSALAANARGSLGFFRVQAFCDVDNAPSRRTLEKAGFIREGRHERFNVHPNLSAEPRPCYMFAKCR
jgi:[ribosomal protein S5]-alanine N-acetyltransferase